MQSIISMEKLEQYLEGKFMAKLFHIMKNLNLPHKQQYEIASIFRTKYTTELISMTDDPEVDLRDVISNINKNNKNIIIHSKEVRKPISRRTFLKFYDESRKIFSEDIKELRRLTKV